VDDEDWGRALRPVWPGLQNPLETPNHRRKVPGRLWRRLSGTAHPWI